jgi:enterobactin synthetase component D / holo-[acyl-carrier protein] synthase
MGGDAARSVSPEPLRKAIERMLPAAVVVRTLGADDDPSVGASSRPTDISDPVRALRFQRGRTCAVRALSALGSTEMIVGRGPRREPLWPAGFVGSITHLAGLSAAAVGPTTHLGAIGIDAEPNDPLPAGVEELVVTDGFELPAVGRSASSPVNWPTVLFSAKESVYKAWYPVFGTWLDFREVRVELSPTTPTAGWFRVEPRTPNPMSPAETRFVGELAGRYDVDPVRGVVTTTAVLTLDPTG